MSFQLDDIIRKNAVNTDRIMKNAIGYVVGNNAMGITAATTFDNTTSSAILKLLGSLVTLARSAVRDLNPTNNLIYMRVATRKFEYLIAPEKKFTIIVVQ